MAKIIKLENIQSDTKKFYEICSDISVLQKELDQMLTAIERNSLDFEKGKISRELFKYNDDRMKKESAKIIKKINSFADLGISFINKINKEVASQKTEIKTKKKRIKEIKKKMKKKTKKKKGKKIKRKKKAKPVAPETPAGVQPPGTSPETLPPGQKTE